AGRYQYGYGFTVPCRLRRHSATLCMSMERTDAEHWGGREVARLLALVETERRYYQEVVASLPFGLAVVSQSGEFRSSNPAFRQIIGLKAEDMRKRTVDQVLPSLQLRENLAAVFAKQSPASGFAIEIEGKTLQSSVIGIRNWDDDTELEALVVIEDLARF